VPVGAAEAAVGHQLGALSLEGSDTMDIEAMDLGLHYKELLPGWIPTADAPPSHMLGEDAPTPSRAELAEMFARSTAAQDAEAAARLGLYHQGNDAKDADVAALAALGAAVAGGGARPRGGARHQRRFVEEVLQELHSQVGGVGGVGQCALAAPHAAVPGARPRGGARH
jgi:hypothetical protein